MSKADDVSNKDLTKPLITQGNDPKGEGIASQSFTTLPALNEAASYLLQASSNLTSYFYDSSAENVAKGSRDSIKHTQEVVTSSSGQTREPLASSGQSFDERCSSSSGSSTSAIACSSTRGEATSDSTGNVSQTTTSSLLGWNRRTGQNGTSIFQGLLERAQRTVRGSADDIGWLMRDPEMPTVQDGTERFLEILADIRHGLHMLPTSMIYLLVPGLFSNHGPLYFVSTKLGFSKMGLACHIAKIHSEASVEKNAREIKECIEEIYWGSNKRVLILGHSKGGVDAAAALSLYWDDLKDKVAGLAFAQSPYGGSPIASDILREGQLGDYVNMRKLMEILICKVIKGDIQSLEDLTYKKRKEFLKEHRLPDELPVVSFLTEASISPAVLATLSRVAHAELPLMTSLSSGSAATLPVIVPLGAAMAACAQLLQVRYGEKSDGLVTCRDAEVPGSVVVHPERKLDHAWMVYSPINEDPLVPDAAQVCEALLTLLVEVGEKKKKDMNLERTMNDDV